MKNILKKIEVSTMPQDIEQCDLEMKEVEIDGKRFLEFNINGIIPIDGTIWRVVSDLEQLAFEELFYTE